MKKKTVETELYICDACNRSFTQEWAAKGCEQKHFQEVCKHPKGLEKLELQFIRDWDGDVDSMYIESKCPVCNKEFEGDNLDALVFTNKDFLEELAELIKKYG